MSGRFGKLAFDEAMVTAPNAGIPFGLKHAKDEITKAAGLCIMTPDGQTLFLKRSDHGDHEGEWCFPAGGIEGNETSEEAAIRECREETGWIPENELVEFDRQTSDEDVDFTTFGVKTNNPFIPTLNNEHIGWAWAPIDDPPQPLHPGITAFLKGIEDTDDFGLDAKFYAIATRANTGSGWRRVPDTKFSTMESAELYGQKYHKDKSGAKFYKVIEHPDSNLSEDEFKESDHPRGQPGNSGQFGSGGSGKSKGKEAKAEQPEKQESKSSESYKPGVIASGLNSSDQKKKEWAQNSPIKTIDDLYTSASANQESLSSVLGSLAEQLGLAFKNPGVKKKERVERKINIDGKQPNRINDVVRGGLSITKPEEGDRIVNELAKHFEVVDEGWYVTPAGYFDRKALVRFDNGQVGEVQIWHPDLLRAKEEKGHKLYVESQNLPLDDPKRADFDKAALKLYSGVFEGLAPEWKALLGKGVSKDSNLEKKSALDSSLASIPTDELSTRIHSLFRHTHASPGAHNAGSSSHEQNLIFDSSVIIDSLGILRAFNNTYAEDNEITDEIEYPPPQAEGGERVIDKSFTKGGLKKGESLHIEPKADKYIQTGIVKDVSPEGPYFSKWTNNPHFIINTIFNGKSVVAVVANGQQPNQGTIHPDLRSAKAWLKDNGFALKQAQDAKNDPVAEINATPKTLYINRQLLNTDVFLAWAVEQGFDKSLKADDLHVTIAFSKQPVDWDEIEPLTDELRVDNGKREIKPLGDEGAVILAFESAALTNRWNSLKGLGATWDYPEYQPHVTISYKSGSGSVDLSKIKPYDGPLIFGPERFAEVNLNWEDKYTAAEDEADFKEADHPRAPDGKFGSGGSGKSTSKSESKSHESTKIVDGKRVTIGGDPLPAHIQSLKIPPAWTDVSYNSNPNGSLLVTGKDAKGRKTAIYSAEFTKTQAAAKFARISELNKKFENIAKQNAEAMKSKDKKVKDSADCLDLIMKMGIRPGSETDTGAEKKAYGATTLEGKHVVEEDGKVFLRFTGKKGVALNLPVNDKQLANSLLRRAKKSGGDGKLFSNTNSSALLAHTHTLNGGGFKTKDFRTHLGTSNALELVSKLPVPKNVKEYKKAVMSVAKQVAAILGNTPTIALQSYISPVIFSHWRAAI